jgi:gluconolactonase
MDVRPFGLELGWTAVERWADPTTHPPCLQLIEPDGTVSVLAAEGFVQAPNDLVVAADGSIVFTDPPHWPWPTQWVARILRWRSPAADPWPGAPTLDAAGRLELLDEATESRNGIALSAEDRILIVAGNGLRWLDADGGRDWLIQQLANGSGDGMAFDLNGVVYVCTGKAVEVVDPGGVIVDRLPLPDRAFTLNCCFGGDDLRTLFVTDAGHSTLLAFEGMPVPGVPAPTWDAVTTSGDREA